MNFPPLSTPIRRWTFALVLVGMTVTGVTITYVVSESASSEAQTELAVPETPPGPRQITALGRLEPATEVVTVSVPASLRNDRIKELQVQRGDGVEIGQIIAVMDSRDRRQSALTEAEAQVQVAQAELSRVQAGAQSGEIAAQEAEIARLEAELATEVATQQATVERWQAEFETAQSDYERYQSLFNSGAISAVELDQRQLTFATARAQLDEARSLEGQRLETLRESIRQAQANLDRIAEVRPVDVQVAQAEVEQAIAAVARAESELAETYIRAPMDGRILDLYAQSGEVVEAEGIAELGQTSQMQVVAEVYQTDINQVQEGQSAIITSPSFNGELDGIVHRVGLQVLQQEVTTGEAGENLDRKVVEVRIRLNPDASERVADLTNLQVQVAIQPDGE
ncbi:MAG: ABC exporter membrane fusion protein [Leptolyngbyaceae cyanobacterium]